MRVKVGNVFKSTAIEPHVPMGSRCLPHNVMKRKARAKGNAPLKDELTRSGAYKTSETGFSVSLLLPLRLARKGL